MRKMLFIVGSPRRNGCTSKIADLVIQGTGSVFQVRKIVLGDLKLNFCLGCKSCFSTRKCVQRDSMDQLFEAIFDADILVMAVPSYWGDVPGQMKVFFDRSTPLCDENGGTIVPAGKRGYSIAVRAGQRIEENLQLIKAMEHYYGHLGIRSEGNATFERIADIEDIGKSSEVVEKAIKFGQMIASAK